MSLERRTLLKSSVAAGLVGGPFAGFVTAPAEAVRGGGRRGRPRRGAALFPVRDKRDGQVRLHLPRGFSYRSFHDTDVADPVNAPLTLPDGTILPGRHDGMGAFAGRGNTVLLVRNHEVNNPTPAFGPGAPYDEMGGGGTTTIRTTRHGKVIDAYTSLNGTMMNCSGGIMPWGSWVTCEETINGPDVGPDFTGASNVPLKKPHGYVFEVPADGQSNREPITRAGRFAHEAVSFDPEDGILYLTEDNFGFASGFYRYIPKRNPMKTGYLDNEGELQMLAVKDEPNKHLEGEQKAGTTYDVVWIDIPEPDKVFDYTEGEEAATPNNEAIVFVGDQGRKAEGDQKAAYFSRLEGQVYDDDIVYFTSTQGGGPEETGDESSDGYGQGAGQVWAYDTREEKLVVVYQSPDRQTLDFPDNVTTSPRGTLVLCEDNSDDNYLRGLSPNGRLWDICLNRLVGRDGAERFDEEFAGSTFSTDGHTLFVNIQAGKGMTFAIWGPWKSIGV